MIHLLQFRDQDTEKVPIGVHFAEDWAGAVAILDVQKQVSRASYVGDRL